VIDPKIDKSNWSEEEEQKLIRLVSEHGDKSWTRIAAEMGSRSDVQCRFRYKFWARKAQRTASDVLLNAGQSGLGFPALPE
jgi:hypothetical protein